MVTCKLPSRDTIKTLAKTGVPIFTELFLVSLFTMVDMALLKPCGTVSIAAVGLTAEPMNILEFAFWALQTAMVATLSGCFERRDTGRISRTIVAFLKLCAVATFTMAIIVAIFAVPFLQMCGAMDDTLPIAVTYLRIGLVAFIFRRLYNGMADMLKALGTPKWSLWLNLLANAVNVVFDILLINGIGPFPCLGVTGAAIATLLGCMTGFCLAGFALHRHLRKAGLDIAVSLWRNSSRETITEICKTALPMISEKVMIRLGVFLTVRRIALLGASAFATYRILISLQMFAYLGAEAISTTILIFSSRSFAKRDCNEAQEYFRGARICTLLFALGCSCAFLLLGKPLVGLYSNDPMVIAEGARVLVTVAVFQPFQAMALLYAGTMRSCGLAKVPMIATTVGIVVIRPILVYLLAPVFGVMGAWLAISCDEIYRFFVLRWQRRKLWRQFNACLTE